MDKKRAKRILKGIVQVLVLWIALEIGYIVAVTSYDITVFGWIDLRKATIHKVVLVPSLQTVFLCLAAACLFVYRRLHGKP